MNYNNMNLPYDMTQPQTQGQVNAQFVMTPQMPVQVNMPYGMTQQQIQGVTEYAVKKQIDVGSSIQKKEAEMYQKISLEREKEKNALERVNAVEQNRRNRENALIEITQNSDKKLCAIIHYGQTGYEVIDFLYNKTGFVSTRFFASGFGDVSEVLHIGWDGCEEGIYIEESVSAPQYMENALLGKGLALHLPRRRKREVRDAVYSFFMENAEKREIPRHIGWNRMSTGDWMFEANHKNTLGGMLNGG